MNDKQIARALDRWGDRVVRYGVLLGLMVMIFWHHKKMGEIFEYLYHQVVGMDAHYQTKLVSEQLIHHYESRNPLPRPGDEFDKFVRSSFRPQQGRDAACDFFGNKYRYVVTDDGHGFVLSSNGPDGKPDTPDDIVVKWSNPDR